MENEIAKDDEETNKIARRLALKRLNLENEQSPSLSLMQKIAF
jgi:hypothetical protein